MNKKTLLFSLLVFIFSFSLVSVIKIKAAATDNTSGWIWGGSDDGMGNYTGAGWMSVNNTNTVGTVSYGMNIPVSDGNLSGYAWSENLGWLSFNVADLTGCPSGTCSARKIGNSLKGWARILGISQAGANSGGWSGWIKLGSETGDPVNYGIALNADGTITKGQNTSYAWSDELGWVDFSRATMVIPKVLNISLLASPNGCVGCSSFDSTLTADRLATSTASGDITYEFDCNNDGTYEAVFTTANTSQDYTCTYSSTATARVRMTQESVSSEATAQIIISPAVCGNGSIEGTEQCDDGASNGDCPNVCSTTCTNNSCPATTGEWIEVIP